MKVCDVVLNSVWYDPRVRKQIVEYLAQGVEVSCVGMRCARFDLDKIKTIPCSTNVVQIPSKFDGPQKSVFRKLCRMWFRFKMVQDAIIAQQPDLIHANDLNALIPAYAASKKLKCPIVYDSHEVFVENYTSNGKSKLAILMKMIEKYLVKRVDLMICVSNAAADYFQKIYGIKRPLVITNCSLKKEKVEQTVEKRPIFEVLNHGMFYEGRGYELMADSCDLLKDYPNIHLALRGFGRLEKQLRETVDKKENKANFVFYPPVTVQDLIPKAAESSVGVAITLPICLNFKLSVSNKLFEYAAAGLPVIMSDIPEHRYLNEKYGIGVILKENTPACFAQAVKKMYRDREFYDACAKGARRMSDEVNWENEFSKLIEIERSLCGEN